MYQATQPPVSALSPQMDICPFASFRADPRSPDLWLYINPRSLLFLSLHFYLSIPLSSSPFSPAFSFFTSPPPSPAKPQSLWFVCVRTYIHTYQHTDIHTSSTLNQFQREREGCRKRL